jgi:hypothetical protein
MPEPVAAALHAMAAPYRVSQIGRSQQSFLGRNG